MTSCASPSSPPPASSLFSTNSYTKHQAAASPPTPTRLDFDPAPIKEAGVAVMPIDQRQRYSSRVERARLSNAGRISAPIATPSPAAHAIAMTAMTQPPLSHAGDAPVQRVAKRSDGVVEIEHRLAAKQSFASDPTAALRRHLQRRDIPLTIQMSLCGALFGLIALS